MADELTHRNRFFIIKRLFLRLANYLHEDLKLFQIPSGILQTRENRRGLFKLRLRIIVVMAVHVIRVFLLLLLLERRSGILIIFLLI